LQIHGVLVYQEAGREGQTVGARLRCRSRTPSCSADERRDAAHCIAVSATVP
jgi:hypothetical protein